MRSSAHPAAFPSLFFGHLPLRLVAQQLGDPRLDVSNPRAVLIDQFVQLIPSCHWRAANAAWRTRAEGDRSVSRKALSPNESFLRRTEIQPLFETLQIRLTTVAGICKEPAMCRVVAYYRVSTAGQGRSGLGLEAQGEAVARLCQSRGWQITAEFTEVESGKRADRPQLQAALHRAKVTGATLVIAKLDRLGRNVAYLSALIAAGVKFVAADNPEANEFSVHIMAAMAQHEREAISSRTKEALAAAKARGAKLGNPNGAAALRRAGKGNRAALEAVKAKAADRAADYAPVIADIRASGATSLPAIARELNERGIVTARGGHWHPSSVRNLLARLAA